MKKHQLYTQITDDIIQVELPLPFALRIVNCYLIRGDTGWSIIDTGINIPEARQKWLAVFDELAIRPHQLEQIILTHNHPDHFGLSGWLQTWASQNQDSKPPIWISEIDNHQTDLIWRNHDSNGLRQQLIRSGMPEKMVEFVVTEMQKTVSMTKPHPPVMQSLSTEKPFQIGNRIVEVILAEGHSDGHLIFYDKAEQLMFCGDHVLMKITPNIGQWVHTAPNPLGRFITSLNDLKHRQVELALPGHRQFITDWQGRIEELLEHHDHRLQKVAEAVEKGISTVYELAQDIFDYASHFSMHEWRFATAEILAHLEVLRFDGQVVCTEENGIWHYRLNDKE